MTVHDDKQPIRVITPHGGYRTLKSYQSAELVYDATVAFCDRFIDRRSRTHDQMVQAARSGKQNIAEGSMASGTAKKTELKLVGVARASLEELLLDYQDFFRQRGLPQWDKGDARAQKVRGLAYSPNRSYSTYQRFVESSPENAANTLLCLIHQTNYPLDQQLRQLEKQFLAEGGFTERLYRARNEARKLSLRQVEIGPIRRIRPKETGSSIQLRSNAQMQPSTSDSKDRLTRRQFVTAAAASSVFSFNIVRASSLQEKLNMVFIGSGGRGGANLRQFAPRAGEGENVVALCDVNENNLNSAAQQHPGAKKFRDYRRLFDDLRDSEFDAVVVSTTEHTHAFATLPALQRKKNVYSEKPLTHGVREARLIAETAKRMGVVTQMGNQNHSNSSFRRIVELIQSGALGPVREAHSWVSRAWGQQTREEAVANRDIIVTPDTPKETHPVPPNVDWDLWIGPAPFRPYNDVYLPGPRWYRFWDFASGTMSDLGSHWNDLPFWALALDAPKTIEAAGPPPHPDLAPASFSATYEYGPRRNPMSPNDMPACKMTWYQGTMKPDLWKQGRIPQWPDGMLFIGEKATLLANYQRYTILVDDRVVDKFAPFSIPPRTIPDSPGHWAEFVLNCKSGGVCGSNFSYAGPLTEANHLASIAFRVGKKIEWDSKNLRVTNSPEAQRLIAREYRSGWKLA